MARLAELGGTAAGPTDVKAPEPSMKPSEDASPSIPNNSEVEADEAQDDDDDNDGDEDDDDDDNEWSSSDDEDLPVVDNPVDPSNIKGELVKALTSEFKFKGSFSYCKTHNSAPNPCMRIDGFGPLGLPLNPREAKCLIGLCTQAPFGKNERTVVDKKVRDTWELSPDKIHFENPLWQRWVNTDVIPAVQEALGVKGTIVTAEIYKLLLYETGSHFLSHQDTEKIPGMFGSIIITLPSAFEGAALHLSHSGQTRVIDLASTSKTSVSVLAWYSDVFHSVKPVISGYRLAISYNLAVPPASTNLRPSLPDMSPTVNQLRHILTSWRQARAEEAPTKLIYHLEHQYSLIGLGNMSLKGKDAQILSFLRPIAEELQFCIYIANVELHESGAAEDTGRCHYGRRRWGCGYSSDEDNDSHGGMEDVQDSEFTVENVVDSNGVPVHMDFTIEEEEEIPFNLSETAPDQEEYEGYQGNYGGTLEYWYRKTALIIFPRKNESLASGEDPLDYATGRLEHKLIRGWKAEDRNSKHIHNALTLCTARNNVVPHSTLSTLTRCAIEAADMPLWVQSIRACGVVAHPSQFPVVRFVEAIDIFGFDTLRDILEEVLRDGKENGPRLTLLKGLAAKFRDSGDEHSLAWANAQKELVLKVLKAPTPGDVPLLVELAHDRLLTFLEIILPQLESFTFSHKILLALSEHFFEDRPAWSSADDLAILSQIRGRLVKKMISGLSAVSPHQPGENIKEVMSIVHLIDRADATTLLASLASKIKVCFDAISTYEKSTLCTSYLLPLLGQLELARSKSPRLQADTKSFSTLHVVVSAVFEYGMSGQGFISHLNSILAILPRVGGINLLETSLLPHIKRVSQQDPKSVKQFSIALYRSRMNFHLNTPTDQKKFISIIQHLTVSVIASTSFDMTGPSYYQYGRTGNRHDSALQLIQHCFEFGEESLPLCKRVTCRIQPSRGGGVDDWFIRWFTPFVTDLVTTLKARGLNLSAEPFRTLVVDNTWLFLRSIGNKPPEQVSLTALSRFGCGCAYCANMKSFLISGRETEEYREVQSRRTHLERQLAAVSADAWGLRWQTVKSGSPHRLVVTKPAHMVATGRWELNIAQAKKFVRELGDAQTLQNIFGDKTQQLMRSVQLSSDSSQQSATASSSGQVGKRPPVAGSTSASRPAKKSRTVVNLDISD